MKKLAVLLVVLVSSSAFAGTTIYGNFRKEVMYVTQDADDRSNFPGVQDTGLFGSVLGVRGAHKLDSGKVTFGYRAELGLNTDDAYTDYLNGSNGTSNNSFADLRHVYVDVTSDYGRLVLGQTLLDSDIHAFSFDPFYDSTAPGHGLGNMFNVVNFHTIAQSGTGIVGLGYTTRAFVDQISYTTPDLFGFKYNVAVDRDDASNLETNNANKTVFTHTFSYQNKFMDDAFGLNVFANVSHEENRATPSDLDTVAWQLGLKLAYQGFAFAGIYGMASNGDIDTNGTENQDNRMFFALSYDGIVEGLKLAATYSNFKNEVETSGSETEDKVSQFALGAKYNFTSHVAANATFFYTSVDTELDSGDNDAFGFATGISVSI